MAAFVHCPHCHHPAVLPAFVPGMRLRCRQCLGMYVLRPIPSRSRSRPVAQGEDGHRKQAG